jgi:hypothetical protein
MICFGIYAILTMRVQDIWFEVPWQSQSHTHEMREAIYVDTVPTR